MPRIDRRPDSLKRRQARAVENLRETFTEFHETLTTVEREADNVLRTEAARNRIPFNEGTLDNPRAAPLLKAHAKLLDEQMKVEEAHSAWARAIVRAVRIGVFPLRSYAGKVRIIAPADLEGDAAVQAAVKWVAMHQYPLGDRLALRKARSGLERRVKDPMTKHELEIASVCFAARRSGARNWAAAAQRTLTRNRMITPMTRQAFHKLLRRLEIHPRPPLQVTPIVITLRRPRSS